MGDARGQHVIESRNAIGGDEQKVVLIDEIHVADFAAGVQL
jgi:hypothetical protein